MTQVFAPSANDLAVFTTDRFPLLKDGDGNTYRTVVKANVNGSIDVYSKGTGLFGGDELLFQYSGTSNAAFFANGKFKNNIDAAYDSFFRASGSNGEQFVKDVKTKWYSEAPPNAARRMATLSGYRSIAATTPVRKVQSGPPSLTITTGAGTTTIVSPTQSQSDLPGPQAPVLPEPGVDIQDSSNPYNYIGGTATNPKIQFSDTLIYPLDIAQTDQDRIKFTAADINGRSNQGTFAFGRPLYKSVSPPVYISIQSPISDQNTVDWGEGNLSPLDATLYNSAFKAMNNTPNGDVGGAMTAGAMGLAKALEELKNQFDGQKFNQLVASLAAGNPSIFTRATSLVLNPNLELLFRGPQLRPFNFTFLMSARNSSEVYIIKEIIRYFKYHMAVREVPGGLFLKAPYVFKIQYQKGNQLHKSINLIAPDDEETKACALINFSVDYTPLGSYMTYEDPDATMVAYRLNMQFQEITPVYDTDYTKSPAANHPIGY